MLWVEDNCLDSELWAGGKFVSRLNLSRGSNNSKWGQHWQCSENFEHNWGFPVSGPNCDNTKN